MSRIGRVTLAAATLVGLTFASTAAADETPNHAHVLLVHPQVGLVDGAPHIVAFHRCVDLAANQALPNHVHHATVHEGAAGAALRGAGHAVVPAFAFADCAGLEGRLPLAIPPSAG